MRIFYVFLGVIVCALYAYAGINSRVIESYLEQTSNQAGVARTGSSRSYVGPRHK